MVSNDFNFDRLQKRLTHKDALKFEQKKHVTFQKKISHTNCDASKRKKRSA